MQNNIKRAMFVPCLVIGLLLAGNPAHGAREAVGRRDVESAAYQANALLKRGEELLESGETERGIRMLESVIEQNLKDDIRFQAYLRLGKHYLDGHEPGKAVEYLRNIGSLKRPGQELSGDKLELYLEGLYLTGVAHFQARQYGAAFSILRKITSGYPNTSWANEAYYYIGMSHFAQGHWSKAISNLGLVGTFVDPTSPEIQYAEAGRRLYVKISDRDLPVLQRQGKEVVVKAEAASGDREEILCKPQLSDATVFVGSVRTEIGKGTPGDDIIHLVGGDTITVKYTDDSDQEGNKNTERRKQLKVVSTGVLAFTLGTYDFKADVAFLGQPVFVRVKDVDLDKSDGADKATVRLTSIYKAEEKEEEMPTMTVDIDELMKEVKEEFTVRDEVTLTLNEVGEKPVHTGTFVGSLMVTRIAGGEEPNRQDNVLSCDVSDQIVATYIDELTMQGEVVAEVTDKLTVFDEIDSRPRADQDVVAEAITRAKKELVEAEAYLEIARIFQSTGLKKGAKEKADLGLERVDFAITSRAALPPELRERAFSIKWNLYLAQDDFGRAMATCRSFSSVFPESPLVDNALMGIAKIYMKKDEYGEAIKVLQQIAGMPRSHCKAEAQFLVAQIRERMDGVKSPEAGIADYKLCAQRFPDSEFAGPSLAKVVDYHIATRDYSEADELLTQIFLDYQDEDFLDSMLIKWVEVAGKMGDTQKAAEKCKQLLFEYPGSQHANKAAELLQRFEEIAKEDKEEDNTEGAN